MSCLAASGCSQKLPLETIYQSSQCAISAPTLKRVENADELRQLMHNPATRMLTAKQSRPPNLADFGKASYVVYALGQKPTAGYGIKQHSDQAFLDADILRLPLEESRPEPGMMRAQVLTSPCLVLRLPKIEFNRIELVSPD